MFFPSTFSLKRAATECKCWHRSWELYRNGWQGLLKKEMKGKREVSSVTGLAESSSFPLCPSASLTHQHAAAPSLRFHRRLCPHRWAWLRFFSGTTWPNVIWCDWTPAQSWKQLQTGSGESLKPNFLNIMKWHHSSQRMSCQPLLTRYTRVHFSVCVPRDGGGHCWAEGEAAMSHTGGGPGRVRGLLGKRRTVCV